MDLTPALRPSNPIGLALAGLVLMLGVVSFALAAEPPVATSAGYEIFRDVEAGGGETSSAGYTMQGQAVGEATTIETSTSAGYRLRSGYLFQTASSPEMAVLGNSRVITNGNTTPSLANHTDFGAVAINSSLTRTFTISNSGTADLTLTGSPAVTLTTGTHFSVTQPVSTTLKSGETTTFTVTFDPQSIGSFTDTVNIVNNDSDENPYTFVIQGNGVASDLQITKQVSPTTAEPGETVTYTLNFTNAGDVTATGVVITDVIPVSMTITSIISSGVVITQTSSSYTWSVQDLASGQSGVITIIGQVNSDVSVGTAFTNTATIATNAYDSNVTNDSASAVCSVDTTTTVSLDGNDLKIEDTQGADTDDNITISTDGTILTIHDPLNNIGVRYLTGTTGNGTNTVTVPLAQFSGTIIVDTFAGDDTLTVDFGNNTNPFTHQIIFNGESQTSGDELILSGTITFADATFGFTNENDGTVDVTGNAQITYTGLESIAPSLNTTNVTLNYGTAAETIAIQDAGSGQTLADSEAGTVVTFNNPNGQLTVNAGDGDDSVNIESLANNFPANLIVDGQGDTDIVRYLSNISLGASESLDTTAETIILLSSSLLSGGTQSYNGPVILAEDTVLTASGVIFADTVDSAGDADLGTGAGGTLNLSSGTHTIDTDNGQIDGVVSPGFDGTNFNFTDITIASGVTLTASGSQPLILLATGAVQIDGTISAVGQAGGDGGGDRPGGAGGAGGPGGYAGGAGGGLAPGTGTEDGENGQGPGGGGGGKNGNATADSAGGGGAGHAASGENGSKTGGSSTAGVGGVAYASLPPLIGGSGGGGGAFEDDDPQQGPSISPGTEDDGGGGGGGGGGAVYVAGKTVTVTGLIDASGGKGGNSNAGAGSAGGGGGSGGSVQLVSILIPTVTGSLDVSGGGRGTGEINSARGGAGAGGRTLLQAGVPPSGYFSLTVNATGNTVFEGIVGGADALTNLTTDSAGSTLLIGGAATTTGTQTYNDEVILGADTTLTSQTADINFNNNVSGAFDLTLAPFGTATFAVGTTSTYTGTTSLVSGTTQVNGIIDNSGGQVTVQNGAVLGGTGTVARTVIVDGGGRVAPGLNPGILTTGLISFSPSSTYTVEIGGTSPGSTDNNHDQLVVNGTVTLGTGAILETTSWNGFTPSPSDVFVIIENDGSDAVSGTFSGLPEGSTITNFFGSGLDAFITYTGGDGNDVVLTVDEEVDVQVSKSVTPLLALPGDPITYTLIFSNSETGKATAAVITDVVPISVTVTSIISSGDIAITETTNTTPIYTFQVANMEQNQGGIITITGVLSDPLTAGIFTNTVEITSTMFERDTTNNTASAGLTVVPRPNITFGNSSYFVNEGDGQVDVTVLLSQPISLTVTAEYYSSDGTASSISDYQAVAGGLTFAPNETVLTITVPITDDLIDESNETVILTLENPTSAVLTAPITTTIQITDDDYNLVINEIDYDQPGTDTAEFIELKNIGTNSINLDNYIVELFNGSISTTYKSIDLPNVNLLAGNYYVICANNATVPNCDLDVTPDIDLIRDGAPDAVGLRLSDTLKDAVSYEGDSGAPYVEGSGTGLTDVATDPIADKDKSLSRIPDGTDTDKNNVDFSLRCITPGAANTTDNSQCGAPVIEFSLAGYQVNEDGSAVGASVTLTRTGKITNASEVQVSFSDGMATGGGVDYTSDPLTVTFPAGNAGSQAVSVPVTQDFLNEPDETLTMTLTAVTNAFIGTQVTATLTIVDDDIPAVLVSPTSGLTTTEAGGTDTFQLVLQSEPTDPVTVTVVSTDPGEGIASPASVTFTPLTWNDPQTITVTGQDDDVDDGDQAYTIQTAAQSSDSDYDGISVADVSVTNLDDDTRGVTVTPTGLTVTEGGITDTYTVVLDSEPTAPVAVTVSSGTQLEVKSTSPVYDNFITLTFTTLNWDEVQTVTVQAVDDTTVEGDHSGVITHAISGGDYGSESAGDVTAAITDNDVAYTLTVDQATVTEGDVGSSPVVFTIARTGAVTTTSGSVDFALSGSAANGTDYDNISPAVGPVAFALGEVTQTISLDVLGDYIDEADETISMTLSSPVVSASSGTALISGSNPVSTTIVDDDASGVTLAITDGITVTEGGATDSYTVVLNSVPTATVTIVITPDSQLDLGAGAGSAISLTFAADLTALDPQTVTVTAVDDATPEGDHTGTITHTAGSSDPNYTGGATFTPANTVIAAIIDNDFPAVQITQSGGSTDVMEGGLGDSYQVQLTTQPSEPVTVTLTPDSQVDLGSGAGQAINLTFAADLTALDPQTVTVTAVDDVIAEGIHTGLINHTAASSDPDYNGGVVTFTVDTTATVGSAEVTVNIIDNDTSGVNYTPTSLTLAEPDGQGSITITLTSEPTATVTITLSQDDASVCSVTPSSVQLDSSNWQSGVSFVVTVQDDDEAGGSRSCIVSGVVSSSDPNYDGSVDSTLNFSVTVTVEDDDTQPIYLPLLIKGFDTRPDLLITDLQASSNDVTVTIVNAGTAAVVDAFWIDVYFDLNAPPGVNQPWPTTDASHGVVWGLVGSDLPIMPGESRTLTLAEATQFFDGQQVTSNPPYPVGVNVYGFVDSVESGSTFAAVEESDESNNVFGPVTSEAGGATSLSDGPKRSLTGAMPAR